MLLPSGCLHLLTDSLKLRFHLVCVGGRKFGQNHHFSHDPFVSVGVLNTWINISSRSKLLKSWVFSDLNCSKKAACEKNPSVGTNKQLNIPTSPGHAWPGRSPGPKHCRRAVGTRRVARAHRRNHRIARETSTTWETTQASVCVMRWLTVLCRPPPFQHLGKFSVKYVLDYETKEKAWSYDPSTVMTSQNRTSFLLRRFFFFPWSLFSLGGAYNDQRYISPLPITWHLLAPFSRRSCHFLNEFKTLLKTIDAFETKLNVFRIKTSFFRVTLQSLLKRNWIIFCPKKTLCGSLANFLNHLLC